MTEGTPKKALVYGSCVSRDLTRIDKIRFETLHYTARQSWISAYSDPRTAPKIELFSAFQKRMLENDFQSSGRQVLTSTRPLTSDVIILDLIDERLGVLPYQGSWITYSNELDKTKIIDKSELQDLVEFGSDTHFSLWKDAAFQVRADLDVHIHKVFVLAAKFAEHTDDGKNLQKFRDIPAASWNLKYQRYYDELEKLGFQLVSQSSELTKASEAHLWGATPFHYVDEAYKNFGDKILVHLGNNH
ncbi:DUF6270 domain-containing protein [Glutamicibacter arilaitensis]|uniref:DUF6270 domain-containing protein n=1 Tax=Glutamicibacter arilaitensis TaxID=256701 RepID=UPI00384D22BF